MRDAFWAGLIAVASIAIGAGFFQASLTTHPPPTAQVRRGRPAPPPPVVPVNAAIVAASGGAPVTDAFSDDDVVVERARTQVSQWQRERLVLFVGVCGRSPAVEGTFLRLGVPIAFVVDPNAAGAPAIARLARDAGDAVFVQVDGPPGSALLASFARRLGPIDGVASRSAQGVPQALAGTSLAYFDERGDGAGAAAFAAAGVPHVSRDVTVDDRPSASYTAFMVARAAALSRRAGPVVALMRPLPSTLRALQAALDGRELEVVSVKERQVGAGNLWP